jgi:hypothetical protein
MLIAYYIPCIPDFGINVKSTFIPSEVVAKMIKLPPKRMCSARECVFQKGPPHPNDR